MQQQGKIKRDRSSILAEEREKKEQEKLANSRRKSLKDAIPKTIGNCPYCDGKIEARKKEVRGKKVELYACSNAKWTTEDGEMFEVTQDSTCDFRIWQNALSRYGHWLKHSEVRKLLNLEDVIVTLKSMKRGFNSKRTDYKKYIALDREYGVKVLFEIDVEEEEE